jgi:hypothetical protein
VRGHHNARDAKQSTAVSMRNEHQTVKDPPTRFTTATCLRYVRIKSTSMVNVELPSPEAAMSAAEIATVYLWSELENGKGEFGPTSTTSTSKAGSA